MKVAVLQMTSGVRPEVNAEVMVTAIADASAGGAAMLFTPEMSGLLDSDAERASHSIVREADDATLAAMRAAARHHGIWVHVGSLAVTSETDPRWANRGFVIDATGSIVVRYDKVHLFDVDLPTGESWRESKRYAPGHRSVIVDTPIGMMGIAICYDMRFPALFQAQSDAGASVLSIPAAFTVPTGRAHWHVLLRARAIENAAFVIAAAQCGQHEDGRETYGHSLVIDPWGEIVVDMGEAEGLAFADLDTARVDDVRSRIPVIDHRRAVAAPTAQ